MSEYLGQTLTPARLARLELMATLGSKYGMPLAVCYVAGKENALDDWALDLGARETAWLKENSECL